MNTNELNVYIKNYLENDKTQRAIMLTAPWGSGKSYYIKHELCPFLLNNKLDFACVSVYGIKDIKELNKELFLEINFRKSEKNKFKTGVATFGKTLLTGAIGIGKTLLKNLAKVDIDINASKPNYEKLFESVNLKNRLIIFEDVERSGINIIEFMGYINNLVEQDAIKVLLVVNENEILEKQIKIDKQNNKIEEFTIETKKYLKIKEKTVSDTVHFSCDYYLTIKNIIEGFSSNKYIGSLLEAKDSSGEISLIRRIMQQTVYIGNINFRSLIYACQKTVDMLNKLPEGDYNLTFIENILIGTIVYSIRLNKGQDIPWNRSKDLLSSSHGCSAYPLYKIMYDFIHYQFFSIDDFQNMQNLFLSFKEESEANEVLNVIYHYHKSSEIDLTNAIDELLDRLKKDKGINYNSYLKIANYLIAIDAILDYSKIKECLRQLLINAQAAARKGIEIQTHIWDGVQLESDTQVEKFNKFKEEITKLTHINYVEKGLFDYKPESISKYYDSLIRDEFKYLSEKSFINQFDIDKLLHMLKNSSAEQINDFRGILLHVYARISNISEFLAVDLDNIKKLKEGVDALVKQNVGMDKIQILQMVWLSGNLNDIINKLQGDKNA